MAKAKPKTPAPSSSLLAEAVYIDPMTDFGFKKLFLNKELLIAFLNDILAADIRDITYQPTEGLGEYRYERTAVFDLLCTVGDESFIIVEMQIGQQTFFRDRVLFYASHVIRKQAPKRKYWDFNLKAVYVVSILDFTVFRDRESEHEVIEKAGLYRERTRTPFSDKLRFVFIELPKFKKTPAELQTNTDTWLYLLKHTFTLKSPPPEIRGRIFKRFFEIAQINKLTHTEMETFEKSLKKNFYLRDMVQAARIEERIEGRKQFAIKLLLKDIPIDEIIYLTDLTRSQILELQKHFLQPQAE
ncbi:MAG: Rpn family recombination-promoting nuclease/putative transposase [Tannerella sp.]|jgi:predicted transposase/invertase (TIGR01784 family)|nr:Rpn family recombination-promoting nuclease/putative transposase [Tannerella sp.]